MADKEVKWSGDWIYLGRTPQASMQELLKIMRQSETGEEIYYVAAEKLASEGRTFSELLSAGDTSLTDTTLIRRFSPANPSEIEYSTRSRITVNRHHNVLDAVLDLAHELTHYGHRPSFNPYRQDFHWQDFVHSTVEGIGGEVEAYIIECKVMLELRPDHFHNGSKCLRVYDPKTKIFSKLKTTKEFYKVGEHYDRFHNRLRDLNFKRPKSLPISGQESLFLSSAYGLPYPLAALEEYAVIMATVCQKR